MERKFVCLHFEHAELFRALSPEDCRALILAMYDYSMNGEVTEFDGMLGAIYAMMKSVIDDDIRRFHTRCEANRQNALARWNRQTPQLEYGAYEDTPL